MKMRAVAPVGSGCSALSNKQLMKLWPSIQLSIWCVSGEVAALTCPLRE